MDFDAVWQQSVNQLNQSIINDNYEQFLNLLQQNISVNSPDNRGYLPIHLCCCSTINPHQYLIELLKFDVVNVNAQTYEGHTALILVSQNTRSPLINLIDSFKLLVQNEADINLSNSHLEFPLLESIKTDKYELVDFLCSLPDINLNAQDSQGISAVHEAVKHNIKYLELLCKYSARIDLRNSELATPLFFAVFYRNCKAVSILLKIANDKGIVDYVNIPTEDRTSSLMIACQTNCLDCIKCLLNNGANVNLITTDHITVLHFVAEFCFDSDCEVLKLIMNHNFDLNKIPTFTNLNDRRIFDMKNPVHLAIASSNSNVLKNFIEQHLFSINSFQLIEDQTIINLRTNSNLFYSTLAFALSIGSSRQLIDYLIKTGASLELYSDSIVPPVFCVFTNTNSINKCIKIFKHLFKIGFDVNKFANLKFNNYSSNFILIIFLPELLNKFLNYGLISEFLFDSEICYQRLEFDKIEFIPFIYQNKGLDELFKSFNLIKRTKNAFKFWKFLKSNISNDSNNDQIIKIDKLFETPNTLRELCLYEFRKTIYKFTQNSAKYYEHVKNLNISPVIKIDLLDN